MTSTLGAGAIALLRGAKLKEHLQALSNAYSWNSLGSTIEVGPKSVTKRRPNRRVSIIQTPVRSINLQADENLYPSKSTPLFATNPIIFLASLDDASTGSENESENDSECDSNVIDLCNSLNQVGIVEYVPAPSRPVLATVNDNTTRSPNKQAASTNSDKNKKIKIKQTLMQTKFKQERVAMTQKMFHEFNLKAFRSALPADLPIKWNKRLLTTAGITKLKLSSDQRTAIIELSEKVVDDVERLKNTLLHELCHAAAWIVDGERRPPHGRYFWKWAKIVSNGIEDASITTCHSYLIHKPFKFQCINNDCGQQYNRHSKSINVDSHRCGTCRSRIEYKGKFDANGTPRKRKEGKELTGFASFVKENFARVKESLKAQAGSPRSKARKEVTHQDIMQSLSKDYYSQKENKGNEENKDPFLAREEENSRFNPIVL